MSINFQKSITKELDVIKNRVRDLIGSTHCGEEGRFKEAILKNIIKKFLPKNLSIGTGFISNSDGHISKQHHNIDKGHPIVICCLSVLYGCNSSRGTLKFKLLLSEKNKRKNIFNALNDLMVLSRLSMIKAINANANKNINWNL